MEDEDLRGRWIARPPPRYRRASTLRRLGDALVLVSPRVCLRALVDDDDSGGALQWREGAWGHGATQSE